MQHMNYQLRSAEMERCIQDCTDCSRICLETVTHCLQMGGKHAEESHIRLLLDCANICQTSAEFMILRSEFHGQTCGVCADVCASCADSCARIDPNDQQMKVCADMCRRCAESCRAMATH